uniref:arsenate reductase ArsC n=1 Tax=Cupriavidus taiwanensis TaxID=164546 RepID=UPI003F497B97
MPRLAATPEQIRATVLAMLTEAGDAAPPTAARFRRAVSVRKLRARHPTGHVNPYALRALQQYAIAIEDFRSKSWDEFSQDGAPELDFVFTVCDKAAGEVCPVWPGQPMTAHWGVPDPAAIEGAEDRKLQAIRDAAITLKRRIELFLSLPIYKLDNVALQKAVREIGQK